VAPPFSPPEDFSLPGLILDLPYQSGVPLQIRLDRLDIVIRLLFANADVTKLIAENNHIRS